MLMLFALLFHPHCFAADAATPLPCRHADAID
jgi:hypothetical protein